MSIKNKIISVIMAFLMMLGSISCLISLPVMAEEKTDSGEVIENIEEYYTSTSFDSKQSKLDSMTLMLSKYGYELYYEYNTGEVGVKNTKTGDIILSNPYDAAYKNGTKVGVDKSASNADVIKSLLSQIIIKYTDKTGQEYTMNSFVEAAVRKQIKIKKIKNGIRVEYIMGKQESRYLVPMMIEKSRFEELILANITDTKKLKKLSTYYVLMDPNGERETEQSRKEMYSSFPITEKYAVYVFDASAQEYEKTTVETIIKEFCPEYTYEEVENDHALVEYEKKDENPVQFRLALEYYLDEYGVSVRLPANGIRFDQTTYTLQDITVLPYMGAGSSEYTGYTMIPDGSGALIRFEDVLQANLKTLISGNMYGIDYAYHTIKGRNQQVMRLPVFGVVEDTQYPIISETETIPDDEEDGNSDNTTDEEPDDESDDAMEPSEDEASVPKYQRKSGFVAIIEEGDALATLTSEHGGNIQHKYNSVYVSFQPRPKDSYNLASSISVAGDNVWTVVSDRKYTGSLRIRYIMLSDLDYANENPDEQIDVSGCYDTSYVGMAFAYRNQLVKNGVLTKNASEGEDIPLYIETLGVMDVKDTFLSIPITVKKPLTTFDNIKTITNELEQSGITNLVYKLTGYINGGMKNTLPSEIKVEKVAGDEEGLKDFISFTNEKGNSVYLDIDFSYAKTDKMFDGFSKKTQAIKTIDNRYTQKRTYSAVLQYFTNTGLIAISPSEFANIFNSASEDIEELGLKGVSLGTIGSDLNSDFDEDDPYNREDSKNNIVNTLANIREAGYSVMLDSGNSYTVPYADNILNVALNSSNYTNANESIPLYGLVFHGYVNYAGTATNMAGDIRYETLKMLENGANPYFILVYQNSDKLKEDETLSKYYSISYENWKEDLIATYNKLNSALGKVNGCEFSDHEFLIGERVPSAEEKAANDEADRIAKEEAERLEAERLAEEERKQLLKEHLDKKKGVSSKENNAESDESENSEEDTENNNGYVYTRYTVDNSKIVKVSFENGYSFILNYNVYEVTVSECSDEIIEAFGYLVLDSEGKVVINSGEEAEK